MTKQVKAYIKANMPYYGAIGPSKGRYKGVKGKAWDILSDFVRCRDFLRFKGECVSSGARLTHWRDGDAGHYISMAGHGAYLGFMAENIHLQSKNENQIGSMDTGARFRDTLERRYGKEYISVLEHAKKETVKADDWYFLSRIQEMHDMFQDLKKEFPFGDFPKYI
jgi:hypothetical protein